ncbi:MAG: hypothetical protein KF893_11130 [Caldilineaceae bacterium]|nr:hypothetical protein [Caldilineaceae bacterium]
MKGNEPMRVAGWMVISLSVIGSLLVGMVGLFALLVAFNGVSEAKATPLLIAYLVLLLAVLGFTGWASRWSFQTLTWRTRWSSWVRGPLAVVAVLFLATLLLGIGLFVLVMLNVA